MPTDGSTGFVRSGEGTWRLPPRCWSASVSCSVSGRESSTCSCSCCSSCSWGSGSAIRSLLIYRLGINDLGQQHLYVLDEPAMHPVNGGYPPVVPVEADPFADLDVLAMETYTRLRVIDKRHRPLADHQPHLALVLHLFERLVGTLEAGAAGQHGEQWQPMRRQQQPVVRDGDALHQVRALLEQERLGIEGVFLGFLVTRPGLGRALRHGDDRRRPSADDRRRHEWPSADSGIITQKMRDVADPGDICHQFIAMVFS